MKIEHQLTPAMQAVVKRKLGELNQYRQEYLLALGRAKEIETIADQARNALGDLLGTIQATEALPEPLAPYRLNEAGTHLIGEIADPAPRPAPVEIPAAALEPAGESLVNGVDHAG